MTFWEYLGNRQEILLGYAAEHVLLVLISMGIATVVGVPLGILAHRYAVARAPIVSVTSFFLTIPSLALFSLFIPLLGLGFPPAVAALTMYALLPIVNNTIAGLGGVDRAILKASRGMGMSATTRLLRVEMPLAWPVIVTGVRVSTQIVVGIAAIAALVGGPGLGQEIFRGLRTLPLPTAPNLVYGGTLAIVVIALLFDALFLLIRRFTTSRGIR